ncbi:MAG TPA: SAF domain-containing protein [Nocardioidaceae bacterium]|nr:SAF domain-containing protein [Nocardioidaceae bacterium]
MIDATTVPRAVRRAVLGRRRLLAALLTAVAVAAGLHAVAGPPPPTTTVVAAARDIAAGSVLRASDLRDLELPPDAVPAGTLGRDALIGRTTTGPLRVGEAITDARVVHRPLLAGYPGLVAAPVRVGDAAAVSLLRVGDRIDLLATDAQGFRAEVVARDAPVLAIPRVGGKATAPDLSASGGRLMVVAVPEESAVHLAEVAVSSFISVVLNR